MRRGFSNRRSIALTAFMVGAVAASASAQGAAVCARPDTVVRVPQAGYAAGGLHRFFFGGHYRDLWADTLRMPVLHLSCVGGGLTVVKLGGGQQTKSLRLQGANGRLYAFRSLDKDPSKTLPLELRGTIADRVLQDQISAALPAGPLIAARLADALDVPTLEPVLYAMADDPALGEYRATFAGMIGFLEINAADAQVEAEEERAPISTPKLFARLDRHADEAVDLPAFLTARLFDVYLGDWDRHEDQWRWVARTTPEGRRWAPVPRDRDQAFSKYDGLLLAIARSTQPKFLKFGPEIAKPLGATWNGRDLDRRLLSAAEKPLWDSIATSMQVRLTDRVIDEAAARMTPVNAREQAALASALKARRAMLPLAATRFYRQLALAVDIHASNERDSVRITWRDDRSLAVHIESEGRETYRRLFLASETQEVRIYLKDGKDRILLTGAGPASVGVRLIDGDGSKRIIDALPATRGGTRVVVYDLKPNDSLPASSHISVSSRKFVPPAGWDSTQPPPRDWGTWTLGLAKMSYGPDLGLFVGASRTQYFYGFRQLPYRASLTVNIGFATGPARPLVEVVAELPEWTYGLRPLIRARASGIDFVRYYGIGNETVATEPRSYYRTPLEDYRLDLALQWRLARRARLTGGGTVRYIKSDIDDPNNILYDLQPYGSGNFGMVGATLGLDIDTRNLRSNPTRGITLSAGGSLYPRVWDVQSTFGEAHGQAATYLTPFSGAPTLALRAGAKKVWGAYPFIEAAFAGGLNTVRGFREQRFAGDAAVWAGGDLRQHLFTTTIILPARVGIFALGDIGRVYVDGESSSKWHTGFGGGVSLGYLSGTSTLSAAMAHSDEGNAVYIRGGFDF